MDFCSFLAKKQMLNPSHPLKVNASDSARKMYFKNININA